MKKFIYILLLLPMVAMAQTQNQNYVKTTTYKKPFSSTPASPTAADVQVQVNYFDGLGRPTQSVTAKAGADGQDIIQPVEYDRYGRQVKEYLPYAQATSNDTLAFYRHNPISELLEFYDTAKYDSTPNPYSEKRFEKSPLGRIFEQAAPGEAWKLGGYTRNDSITIAPDSITTNCAPGTIFSNTTHGSVKIINNTLIVRLKSTETWFLGQLYPICPLTTNGVSLFSGLVLPDLELGPITATDGQPTGYKAVIQNNHLYYVAIPGMTPHLPGLDATLSADLTWYFEGGHTIKYDYQANEAGEVRRFTVDFPVSGDTEQTQLGTTGFYAPRQLYKNIVKDENWTIADGKNKTTEEFKDKQGRVVLKRAYNAGQPHDTYYVYDKFSNLSFVIPPLAADDVVTTTNNLSQGGTNFPWTRMALVDQKLADDYDTELSAYDNEEILNLDLVDKYGGQGGFSVSANNDGNVTLTMNITVSDTLHLRTGIIADISALGTLKDQEIGKIEGPGYGYYFLVTGGKLEISGKGTLPMLNLNATLAGGTPLEYSKNYAWTKLAVTDPLVEQDYNTAIAGLDNTQILSTYTANTYGARGGIAIGIDAYDTVTVSLNITSDTPLELQTGTLFPLDIYRRIPNRTLGTVTGTYNSLPYSYTLSLVDNALQVTGSGQFVSLNLVDTRASSPTYEINQTVVEGLCYIYHYDKRNRLIEKKIPGKGWEHMVYDRLDRVILTQDANLRTNTSNTNSYWLFSKYDKFDRVIYTGQITDTRTRKVIQDALDAVASPVLSESRSATGSTSPFQGLTRVNYTNQAFPTTGITFFAISYYDDYNFDMPDLSVPTVNFYGDTLTTSAKGLLTGTRIKALAPSTWSNTLTGYDDKGQPIWSDNRNAYFGTENISDSQLDFTGKPINTRAVHKRTSLPDLVTVDHFDYDATGRLLKQNLKIGTNTPQLIVYNKYDELGQLESKKVGDTYNAASDYTATTGLQTIDYSYNIRGWLKSINDPTADLSASTDLFAFKINYNTGPVPLYNGNIAETYWKSKTDNKLRSYNYEYDALNRLTSANYVGNYPLGMYHTQNENFKEGPITYDKNGNIKTLERWGLKADNTVDKIDVLSYSYFPLSNKLRSVNDIADTNGFNNGTTGTNDDYSYDANGNLKKDLNKGYGTVTGYQTSYNYMNLPLRVSFSGTKYITYVYDATGAKLEKKVIDGSTTTTTQYDGGYVYKDGGLQYFPHAEGYVNVTAIASNGSTSQYARFEYIYQYKDHLGNIRLSYLKNADTDSLQVVEENNYYAFGMLHKGYNNAVTGLGNASAQKYKYQGQELQDELGLGWYSFKWRNYDPAIARFMCIDPLTEDYEDYTPYQFASNQPVHAQEVEGLENSHDLNKRIQLREGRTIVRDATSVSGAVFKGFAASNSTNRYTTAYKGLHKGDTKAAIVDKSKGRVGADGKPTGKPVLRFDKADAKTKYAHINVEGALDHAPIPGGNNTLKAISKIGDGVNAFNKVAVPVALTMDAIRIGDAINQDGGIGQNTLETSAKVGGSWAGAWGGSILGAKTGAFLGSLTGPYAEVAAPVLGLIGGIAGGIGGAVGGEAAVKHTIDNFGKSKPGMRLPSD